MNKPITLTIITTFLLLIPEISFAQMQGGSYILETEPESKTRKEEQLQPIEQDIQIIRGNGWTAVLSNKEDKKKPFLFYVSNDLVNFGEINPGEPLLRTQTISVDPGSAKKFQVVVLQDHPLRSAEKHEIPNTSCDNGNCTNILPDTWNSPLTYGFGYRCENITGQTCNAVINSDTYRRFPNLEAGELPAPLLYSSGREKSEAMIEYKINVPGNQPNSGYTTNVTLLASPAL